MIFDYLRSCYRTQARLVDGSDVPQTIHWYFTSPGAKVFPSNHAFGSLVWEGLYDQVFQGPGEFTRARTWVKSLNAGCKGQHVPGDLVRFSDGLTAADIAGPAPPICCDGHSSFFAPKARIGFNARFRKKLTYHRRANLGFYVIFTAKKRSFVRAFVQLGYNQVTFASTFIEGVGGTFVAQGWVPQYSVGELFVILLAQVGPFTFHMFDNDYTIAADTLLADMVECSYPGYAPVVVSYTGPSPLPNTVQELTYSECDFTGPTDHVAVDTYGFYVTYHFAGHDHLMFAANWFDPTVSLILSTETDQITLLALLDMLDCFHG